MILSKNKNVSGKLIRCAACDRDHKLNTQDLATIKFHLQKRRIGAPVPQAPLVGGVRKCETCLNINPKQDEANIAEYECLNCVMMFCDRCLKLHEKLPNFQDHKSIQLEEEGNYYKTTSSYCT